MIGDRVESWMGVAGLMALAAALACAGDPIEGVAKGGETELTSGVPGGATGGGATSMEADDEYAGSDGPASGEDGETGASEDGASPGAETASDGSAGVVCGDGQVQGLEECDDGNDSNFDDCTELCVPPSCVDGLHSGDESDVDCGGSCERKCARGASCGGDADCELVSVCRAQSCRVPRTCAELLDAHADVESGSYEIERDGSVTELRCDMQTQGGGWTRLSREDFENAVSPAWDTDDTYTCKGLGATMLGGFTNLADDSVERTWEVSGLEHSELRIVGQLIIIDSWDDERASVEVDGEEVWSVECRHWDEDSCGQVDDLCGGPWDDGAVEFDVTVSHDGDTVTLRFSADLDEGAGNESWGIDHLELWAR